MVGILVAVDEGFIKVEEDGFLIWIFAGELNVFACVGNFDGFSEAEYLYLLIEVLPVEIHEVGGLVLAEAAIELRGVVLLWSLAFSQHL